MSVTVKESEITFYAQCMDQNALTQADAIEKHIQLETITVTGVKTRVRKVTPVTGPDVGKGDHYEFTLKHKREDDAGIPSSFETTAEVDRNFFQSFGEAAGRGIIKTRHTFIGKPPKITGVDANIILPAVKYEIDTFLNQETREFSDWVKIDIELDEILAAMREQGLDTSNVKQRFTFNDIPTGFSNMIHSDSATPEQKKKVAQLWEEEFAVKLAPEIFVRADQPATPTPSATEQNPSDGAVA